MGSIAQVGTPAEIADVEALLREYTTWVFTVGRESGHAPTFHGLEEELATLPGVYAPPSGALLFATEDGQPAGCVALKGLDAATGELKRLYVRPAFRGRDLGRRLVDALIARARVAGYRRLILDSHISMTKAHAIYEAAGFRRVPSPPDFPADLRPIVVFMEMDLGSARE